MDMRLICGIREAIPSWVNIAKLNQKPLIRLKINDGKSKVAVSCLLCTRSVSIFVMEMEMLMFISIIGDFCEGSLSLENHSKFYGFRKTPKRR